MKKLLVGLVLLIAACSSKPKIYLAYLENDWKKGGLKGRVKKTTERRYAGGELALTSETFYNENGFIIRELLSDSSLKSTLEYTYTYDSVQKRTSVERSVDGGKKELVKEYSYNDSGNFIMYGSYDNVTKYTYDVKNRLVGENWYVKGVLVSKVTYEYLANGDRRMLDYAPDRARKVQEQLENDSIRKQTRFDELGKPEAFFIYMKDKRGNIVSEEERRGDSSLIVRKQHSYDQYNGRIGTVTHWEDGNKTNSVSFSHKYDKLGNRTNVYEVNNNRKDIEIVYW